MSGGDSSSTIQEPAASKQRRGRSRSSRLSTLVLGLIVLGLVLVANWPYKFTRIQVVQSRSVNSTIDFPKRSPADPVMAGWPYRYWIRYPEPTGDAAEVSRFSLLALSYNLGIAGIIVAALFGYVLFRQAGRGNGNKISISDLLILTLLLATPFAWWQRLQTRAKQVNALQAELERTGAAYISAAWVPKVFESRMPASLRNKLGRIHEVRVEHPPAELLETIVALHDLQVLRIGGGTYDLQSLRRLSANPHLVDLRIAGRQLDGEVLQSINRVRRLRTLNLMRTNVTAEGLAALDALPDLERLSLIHSDVDMADLGSPPWSQTVRELWVGHPLPGDTAQVNIAGWPRLESLLITEFDTQANSTPTELHLRNLSQLASVQLDVFQKFNLVLRDVPALQEVVHADHEWQARVPRGGSIPGAIWCDRIEIDGAESLETLNFFAPSLDFFQVTGTPRWSGAGVAAFYRSFSQSPYAPALNPKTATALIEGLGKSDGPTLVDLEAVPLQGVDLAPLAQNHKIKEIMLSNSGTTLEQWKELEPMQWLTRLEVRDCSIDAQGVRWILDTFPKLEHVAFSPFSADDFSYLSGEFALEVVDRPHLKTLDLGDDATEFFSRVRVVDSPSLALALRLGHVQQLQLQNAPSLTGLAVQGPFPADAQLSGVRDMEFFAVGGPGVTDPVLTQIQCCPSLRALTLAYPAVTAAGLRAFQLPKELRSLHLPGTAINDEIVLQWSPPEHLTALDLRDTEVTAQSVRHLCRSATTNRLVLDRTSVAPDELAFLQEFAGLSELSLAGVGIDAPSLTKILAATRLQYLDLSESVVTDEILETIAAAGSSLQWLALRQCEISDRKLAELAGRHPNLSFDLEGLEVSTELMSELLSRDRVMDRQEWEMQLAMRASMSAASAGQSFQVLRPRQPAMIDVDYFASLAGVGPGVSSATVVRSVPSRQASPPMVQFGRWLGNTLYGSALYDNAADVAEHDSAATTVEATTRTDQEGGTQQ